MQQIALKNMLFSSIATNDVKNNENFKNIAQKLNHDLHERVTKINR